MPQWIWQSGDGFGHRSQLVYSIPSAFAVRSMAGNRVVDLLFHMRIILEVGERLVDIRTIPRSRHNPLFAPRFAAWCELTRRASVGEAAWRRSNLPLFQGSRREAWGLASVGSCIVVLLCCRGPLGCARRLLRYWMNVSCWIYPAVVCISPSIGTSQTDPEPTVGRFTDDRSLPGGSD